MQFKSLSGGFAGNRLSHFIEPRLDRFIAADQPIVSLGIFILVESRPGVLCHAPFHQPHHNLQFFCSGQAFLDSICGIVRLSIKLLCYFMAYEHLLKIHIHRIQQAAILLLRYTATFCIIYKNRHIKALSNMV